MAAGRHQGTDEKLSGRPELTLHLCLVSITHVMLKSDGSAVHETGVESRQELRAEKLARCGSYDHSLIRQYVIRHSTKQQLLESAAPMP